MTNPDPITPAQVLRLAHVTFPDGKHWIGQHGSITGMRSKGRVRMQPFDPEHDLNACALFEEVFAQDEDVWDRYEINLALVLIEDNEGAHQLLLLEAWIRATTSQRLQAAVLTINELDKENKND